MIEKRRDTITGMTFAILSAMSYAVGSVLVREGVTQLASPLVGSGVAMLAATLLMGMIAGRRMEGGFRKKKLSVLYFLLAGLASGCGALSGFFALSRAPVVIVSPIQNTYPLFALLFAQIFIARLEKINFRLVLGAVFVVGGVALITIGKAGL